MTDNRSNHQQINTNKEEQKVMPFARYFALVTALPLLVLLVMFSSCLTTQRKIEEAFIRTSDFKTKSEQLKAQIDALEAQHKAAQEAMIKVRNKLSLEESVKQSWAVQKIQDTYKPAIIKLTNQYEAAKRQWEEAAKQLANLLLYRTGFIVAISMLFAWVCLSMIMYISLRDYKPSLLLSLGCGVSVLALIVVQLYPVLFGFVILP